MKNKGENLTLTVSQQKAQIIKEILIRNIYRQHPPTINQLAKMTNVNRRKIEEIFERRYGQPIYHYFLDVRMKRILRDVRENKIPLKAISEKFGYNHQSALTLAFRRKYGINPSQLRKERT